MAVVMKIPRGEQAAPERSVPSMTVQVAPVTRGPIREIRRLTGTLSASRKTDVAAKISGRIEDLLIDLGDEVELGAVIARLDRDELLQDVAQARADLEVARAELLRAQAELDQAKRELDRISALSEREVAAISELDAAQSRFEVQQANLKVAEAEANVREAALLRAQIREGYAEIRAEWNSGEPARFVSARYFDEGEVVSANEPIATLMDLSSLDALLFVTERDYTRLEVGQEVAVMADAFAQREFTGYIRRLSPSFEQSSRQARIEVVVDNEELLLKPGMFVRASVILQEKEDAILIPTRSLVTREGDLGVYVIDREQARATFTLVQVGIEEAGRTEILSPTLTGEVVTLGQNLIDDETPLRFMEASGSSNSSTSDPTRGG